MKERRIRTVCVRRYSVFYKTFELKPHLPDATKLKIIREHRDPKRYRKSYFLPTISDETLYWMIKYTCVNPAHCKTDYNQVGQLLLFQQFDRTIGRNGDSRRECYKLVVIIKF